MEGAFQHGQNRQQVDDDDIETIFVEDTDWKADTKGAPGAGCAQNTRERILHRVLQNCEERHNSFVTQQIDHQA